jgi:AraC-like DNA-binding protein
MEFEDVPLPFKEGDVTCVPKHLAHTTYSAPGSESLWSYIFVDPEELFRNMFSNQAVTFDRPMAAYHNFHLIMNREEYPKVHYLVMAIIDEMKSQRANYQASVKGLMLSLYVELLRIHTKEDVQIPIKKEMKKDLEENINIIINALKHIQNNYMQPMSIDDLADLCHLSVSHFRRTFHEIMGAAPLDFLNSTRIDAACWFLRSTEDSILTISEKVGFHSISSFNRCFIKLMEIPPSVWRKQTLLSDANLPKASILEFTGWIR